MQRSLLICQSHCEDMRKDGQKNLLQFCNHKSNMKGQLVLDLFLGRAENPDSQDFWVTLFSMSGTGLLASGRVEWLIVVL